MGFHLIGFLGMSFIGMTILNRILEGAFITASDTSILNTLTIVRSQSILGLFQLPMLNMDFFLIGIPRLVKWDYSFFGGNAALFQFMLYSLTLALSFLLFTVVVGIVYQYLARR